MMKPAVESAPVGAQASKQAKEGSKNRSRRRWRKGKVKGEPVAAWKKSRTSCEGDGGLGGRTHSHEGERSLD